MRKLIALLAVLSLTALLSVAAGAGAADDQPQARAAATKIAKVRDNFFSPGTVKIRKGSYVKWVWTPDEGLEETNQHNVRDTKGRFYSKLQTTGSYRKRFRKAGTYRVVCTIHPNMTQKVVVLR